MLGGGEPTGSNRALWVPESSESGLYALPGSQNKESILLAGVSERTPGAVICLLSALQYHHLTTQIAHRVWIAIENKRWEPDDQRCGSPGNPPGG